MIQWEIENKDLVVTPSSLLIPEINELYLKDIKSLRYVFLVSDITDNNPLKSMTERDREKKALELTYPKGIPKESKELVSKVVALYKEYNLNSPQRFLKTIDDQLDQINQILKDVKIEIKEGVDKNGNTVWTSNSSILIMLIEKVNIIQAKRDEIEKRSVKETAKLKARGNLERSALMKGEIKTNAW